MKKMIKNLMLVAVAAMAFVACSQEGDEVNVLSKGGKTYEFTAEINEETRSSFGEKVDGAYPSFWSGYEYVSFYATGNYGYVESMTISDDKKLASFTVVFQTELNAGDIIYAYSGESWTGDEAANKTVSINNSQESTETSVNDRNHYLYAEYTVGEEGVTAPISLSFKHGAAYGKMQLTQFNGSEISEVKITIDENTYTVKPQSLENPTIWFACYEDTNIETFSVEAKVNGMKYGKTIDMASKANPLTFTTGTVSSFKVEGLEEVPADYEITLSSYTITNNTDTDNPSKVWIFSNEAGDYLSIPFNPNLPDELPAGNYTGVDMCYMFSKEYALEYAKFDTSYNLTAQPSDYARWAEDVAVNISRDEHNMLDFTAYVTGSVNGTTKTTKFSYKEVYTEVVEFDGTIKSWTYTDTAWPTYYQIAGDNFSFEIGFYRNRENYIDYRDGGYTLGDASYMVKYFAIRNLVIDGNSLTVSAGTVITNTAGGAGELHDIDITLTANGNDYEFSYYGYINGVAVDNSGSEEPEEPVQPEEPTIKETYNVTWEYYFDFSSTMPYGHAWNVNSNDGGFSAMITTDARNNYTTATSFTPGTYNYHTQYADGNLADGMWFTMAAADIIIEGKTYGASDFDGEMTVVANNGAYDITVDLYTTDGTKITTLVGTFGTSTGGDTEPTALATPTEIRAEATSDSAVTVTWSNVENESGYIITVGTSVKEVGADVTTCEFTDLTANTTYNVSVVAKGDGTTYSDSTAITTTVTTKEGTNTGGSDEGKVVNLTYFTYNGSAYVFKGDDGHNYIIGFRNYNPGTFSLTDSTKFMSATWTDNNTTYFNGNNFAEGDTLELIKNGTGLTATYTIIIRATINGEKVVATCASTNFQ